MSFVGPDVSVDDGIVKARSTPRNQSLIIEDSYVVFNWSDEDIFHLVRVGANRTVRCKKLMVQTSSLLGHPYGTTFEVKKVGKKTHVFEAVARSKNSLAEEHGLQKHESFDTVVQDNRKVNVVAQEVIGNDGREEGANGAEIMKKVLAGAENYHKKTDFAKEKYLRKLVKRYNPFVRVFPASPATVMASLTKKESTGPLGIRGDSLARMLAFCNIHSNSNLLCVDQTNGALMGAILCRMGFPTLHCPDAPIPSGRVTWVSPGNSDGAEYMKQMNLVPAGWKGSVERVQARRILEVRQAAQTLKGLKTAAAAAVVPEGEERPVVEDIRVPLKGTMKAVKGPDGKYIPLVGGRKGEYVKAIGPIDEPWRDTVASGGFESLIIAASAWSPAVAALTFPLLAPGGTFAIFSESVNPLVEIRESLYKCRRAYSLNLCEMFTRPHQVLPFRTHPMMFMHGGSGFILTGYKVGAPLNADVDVGYPEFVAPAAGDVSGAPADSKRTPPVSTPDA